MKTILIPVELCQYIIEKKLSSVFQLYIALKLKCSGAIRLSSRDKIELAELLGYKTVRAINNNLKTLLEENWIGYDSKTEVYFVRGFDSLLLKLNLRRRGAAEFPETDIMNLKAFLVASVIGSLINAQKRKVKREERLKGRSHQFLKPSFTVANKALAKVLKISKSTAYGLKELAAINNYISIKKITYTLPFPKYALDAIEEALPYHPAGKQAKAYLENGIVVVKAADVIECHVRFKRRKKPNYIIRD